MKKNDNRMQWFLEGELRDNSPWIIPVHSDFSIGRLETSDLILSSSLVSRKHAQLLIDDGDLYIHDLQSSNGTFINGKQQDGQNLLRNGDLLKIGISEFKVCSREVLNTDQNDHTFVGMVLSGQTFEEFYSLSTRETEILFFLIKGFNLQEVGDKLFISAGTVKNHVLKIYKKTDCHSRIELSTRYSEYKSE